MVLSQSAVSDVVATLFSGRFYQELLNEGRSAWEAVDKTRGWLRTLTEDEAHIFLQQLGAPLPQNSVSAAITIMRDRSVWQWGSFAHYQSW